jgi:membrane protease YdiL (CAAX protease family)
MKHRSEFLEAALNVIGLRIKNRKRFKNAGFLMDDVNMIEKEISPAEAADSPTYKEQLFEVLTFCFIIVPGLAFSFFAGPSVKENFLLGILGVILSDLALVTLVCFFLWRNGERLTRIGWTSKGYVREIVLGMLAFPVLAYALSFVTEWLQSLGLSFPKGHIPSFLEPAGTSQYIAATLLVLVIAISEETIFRGYLILRFKAVTGSTAAGVIISSLIFTLGHGYEGVGGLIIVGCMGVVFALVYLWRKSLAAPIVMHFMQDFTVMVLLPILSHR